MMEKAFWDLLKEDLESEEPVYEQVLSLLQDIKEVSDLTILTVKQKCSKKVFKLVKLI